MHSKRDRIDSGKIMRLVPLCLRQDRGAWDELVKTISPIITSVIRNKFHRLGLKRYRNEVENLKQNILLEIWEKRSLASIKNTDKIVSWLCAISHYTASNYLRGIKADELPRAEELDDKLESAASSPSAAAVDNDLKISIGRALDMLSPRERIIIKLLYVYDKKYRDIAATLNMPIGTVLAYANRAKAKMRIFLKNLQ